MIKIKPKDPRMVSKLAKVEKNSSAVVPASVKPSQAMIDLLRLLVLLCSGTVWGPPRFANCSEIPSRFRKN
jgi:hypothetical protein